jgi:type IV secretion system protein VirB4
MSGVTARNKTLKLGARAAREVPVSAKIPYTCLLDEHTIKTREGHVLQIIKLDGAAFETADQSLINLRQNARASFLHGLSSNRIALYHHMIRRRISPEMEADFEDPFCADLDHAYRQNLAAKKLYANEHYLTIICRPAKGPVGMAEQILGALSSKIDRARQNEGLSGAHKELRAASARAMAALSEYNPRLLGLRETESGLFAEHLGFLAALINLDFSPVRPPLGDIASYLPRRRLFFGDETIGVRGPARGGDKRAAILSIKDYADETGPGMVDGLLDLPHEFVLTQSFAFVGRQAALSAMNLQRRRHAAGGEGAHSLDEDLEEAIDHVASGRAVFGEHHLTLLMSGADERALDSAVNNACSVLGNLGIQAVREDMNMEAAFWAQLPGNFAYIARRAMISHANFAGFCALHAYPRGNKSGQHWGAAITLLETTSGTPYWFNFHARDTGNFTLIGPTGGGKTVLLTFLHAQAQRLRPRTVYFDKDRGAEIYMRAIGGDYHIVRAGMPSGLNPLQLSDTRANRAFLREWLSLLVTSGHNAHLDAEDAQAIAEAVNASYDLPAHERRLSTLAPILGGHKGKGPDSLHARLARWHSGGERAWLFDHAQDTLTLSNANIGFDMTQILDDPVSRAPWLLYIFHRVNDLLSGEKLIIMLDEGWKLLDDPVFEARIKDWMKTIRKMNGLVGFATQSAGDAIQSPVSGTIIEQSPTQIFLPNPQASERDYMGGFNLTRRELEIIRRLAPSSRCFLVKHGSESVIARLDLGGMEQFIGVLSGRAHTVRLLEDIRARAGEDPANWLPVFYEHMQPQTPQRSAA